MQRECVRGGKKCGRERERVWYRHREQRKSNEAVNLVVGAEYTDYMHYDQYQPEAPLQAEPQATPSADLS